MRHAIGYPLAFLAGAVLPQFVAGRILFWCLGRRS